MKNEKNYMGFLKHKIWHKMPENLTNEVLGNYAMSKEDF